MHGVAQMMNFKPSSMSRAGLPLPPRSYFRYVQRNGYQCHRKEARARNEEGYCRAEVGDYAARDRRRHYARVPCHTAEFRETALIMAERSIRCG